MANGLAARLEGGRARRTGGAGWEMRVEGRREGLRLDVRLWHDNDVSGWVVEATFPAPDLVLSARRRGLDLSPRLENVPIDPGFDRDWLVEAAPAATAREVMSPVVRERLAAIAGVQLDVDGGKVSIGANIISYELAELEAAIDVIVELRARLSSLPSRPAVDPGELARVRAAQDRTWDRLSWPARILVVVLGLVLAVAVGAGLVYGVIG